MPRTPKPPRKVGALFKLDPALKRDAQTIADWNGVTLTSVVEQALSRYVARNREALIEARRDAASNA